MKKIMLIAIALAMPVLMAQIDDSTSLKRADLRIRDPFVLADGDCYYLYESKPWNGGDGVFVRESKDLETWGPKCRVTVLPEGCKPQSTWAPEVHRYKGKYWLFVTMAFPLDDSDRMEHMLREGTKGGALIRRGVWVFRSDSPRGPFLPVQNGSVTPRDWMCLDGTLVVEDGEPWMVFCHEWCQTGVGRMCAAKLKEDFSGFASEPVHLFDADVLGGIVTDGCFLYRTKTGKLLMIWSNGVKGQGYCVIQCESESGKVKGPWKNHHVIFGGDGGHAMIFRTLENQLRLTLHQPNKSPDERMRLFDLIDDGDELQVPGKGSMTTAQPVDNWRPKERWRGVNIIGMFNRRGESSASGFPDSSCGFKEEHFQWVKELGFNFVRLPLDYRNWCPDGNPDAIDEEGLKELDYGIALGRKYGLHVQVCLHHAPGYCILGWKNEPMTLHSDPTKLAAFCQQWAMLAKRYRDIPNDELTFNLLNEPGGITDADYERIFSAAIAAIRKEDPKRFVMLDGTNIGLNPVPAFFDKPLVGQAMRGYAPGGISHYGVHWALRPQTEPTWPLTVESPTMPWIYGPEHEKSRALVVDNAPAGEWTWDFSPADEEVTLEVVADGVSIARHAYSVKQHELFTMRLDNAAKRVEIRPQGRGASRFGLLTIRSADGRHIVRLGGWCQDANIANRAEGDNLHQRFMGWEDEFPFRLAENVGKQIECRGGTPGMDALEKFNFAPWKQASDKGVFCFVGEFGCFNKTPHPIALAWLEDQLRYFKQQNWGWSLWLMNGSFGFIDSERDDVEYEDFHGHKLDRKMLELLQKY